MWSGVPLKILQVALWPATPKEGPKKDGGGVRHSKQPEEGGATLGEGLRNLPGLQEDPSQP